MLCGVCVCVWVCVCVCVCVCACVCESPAGRRKNLHRTFLGSSTNGCSERNQQNGPKYTETIVNCRLARGLIPQLYQKPFFKKSFRKTQAKQLCANNRKTLHVIDTKHCRYGQALSSDGKITWKKTASIINKEELNYYACLREIKKSIRDKKEKKTQFELLLKSLITKPWRGGTCAFSLNLEKSVKGLLLMCSTLPSLFKPPLLYAYIWILPET